MQPGDAFKNTSSTNCDAFKNIAENRTSTKCSSIEHSQFLAFTNLVEWVNGAPIKLAKNAVGENIPTVSSNDQ